MARVDKYGDKGPKEDRKLLARSAAVAGRPRIGGLQGLSRSDGSEATYVETVAGPRLRSDTRESEGGS